MAPIGLSLSRGIGRVSSHYSLGGSGAGDSKRTACTSRARPTAVNLKAAADSQNALMAGTLIGLAVPVRGVSCVHDTDAVNIDSSLTS